MATFRSNTHVCSNCRQPRPVSEFLLSSHGTGQPVGRCFACRQEYNRGRKARKKASMSPVDKAILKADIPQGERLSEHIPAMFWDGWREKWVNCLILGEHTTEHGKALWWLAVLTRPSHPLVATFDKSLVAVKRAINGVVRLVPSERLQVREAA